MYFNCSCTLAIIFIKDIRIPLSQLIHILLRFKNFSNSFPYAITKDKSLCKYFKYLYKFIFCVIYKNNSMRETALNRKNLYLYFFSLLIITDSPFIVIESLLKLISILFLYFISSSILRVYLSVR